MFFLPWKWQSIWKVTPLSCTRSSFAILFYNICSSAWQQKVLWANRSIPPPFFFFGIFSLILVLALPQTWNVAQDRRKATLMKYIFPFAVCWNVAMCLISIRKKHSEGKKTHWLAVLQDNSICGGKGRVRSSCRSSPRRVARKILAISQENLTTFRPCVLQMCGPNGTTWSVGRGPIGGAIYSSSLSNRNRMFFLFRGQW